MDHETELELTRQLATLDTTVRGFAVEVNRRFDSADDRLESVEQCVRKTDDCVTRHDEKINAMAEKIKTMTASPGLTLADLRWYIAIAAAVGTFTWWASDTFRQPQVSAEALAGIHTDITAILLRLEEASKGQAELQRQLDELRSAEAERIKVSTPRTNATPAFPRDERFMP